MHIYSTLADEFYIHMILNTEMKLPTGRETVLNFFERMQKSYPTMRRFYTRDSGDFVLEEDKDGGHQRWISLEPKRICSGYFSPPEPDLAMEQHKLVLDLVPFMLSVSPLDCEALDFMVGFDFNFKGNHDALIAEALGAGSALEGMIDLPDVQILNYEPSLRISLDESCRRQARLLVETRTTPYQVRRSEFPDEQISVYFTVRQYGSLEVGTSYIETLESLQQQSAELIESYVIDQVLRPIANTISTK